MYFIANYPLDSAPCSGEALSFGFSERRAAAPVWLAFAALALPACERGGAPEPRAFSAQAPNANAGAATTSTYRLESPGSAASGSREAQFSALAPQPRRAKLPEPAAASAVSVTCINGWFTPERGSALRTAPLDMMRSNAGERFVVDEMRYFVGPEDAEVMQPQGEVERWYIKAYVEGNPERRQRWLVRRARVGSGVDAVAPYASSGYGPDTWTRLDALDKKLADPFQHPCDGSRPDSKCMGLPRQVLGCLEGT